MQYAKKIRRQHSIHTDKYTEGKSRKPGTTLVTQQQTDGRTTEITDKIQLEKVIVEEKLKKYHQTKGACPLLDESWIFRNIGAFGEGPQVEAILDGTYVCPDNYYQAMKTFLKHLQRPNTVSNKEPPTLMSLAAYRESWKTVKENTSLQRPHIGMYKAAV